MNNSASHPIETGALLLSHLRLRGANLISSPHTWGFPAPSAFTGFVHALQRELNAHGAAVQFTGVGIVCHDHEAQVHDGGYVQTLRMARSPLDADGTPRIAEDARTHLDVSLVIGVTGEHAPTSDRQAEAMAQQLLDMAPMRRLAGGSIELSRRPGMGWVWSDPEQREVALRRLKRRLLPGFALVDRSELLESHLAALRSQHAGANALDALLDLIALHHEPPADGQDGRWTRKRRESGWLVPIPAGYGAISPVYEAGSVKNARDPNVPFRFVESLLTLGEWRSPHRIRALNDLLWRHAAEQDAGLYRVRNKQTPAQISIED